MWRGLTLLCCFLLGIAILVAAYYRLPPSNYRGGALTIRGWRSIKPPSREPPHSDFKPIQDSEQLVGLLEYFGSAGVLWLGCILWWKRKEKRYDQYTWMFLLILILTAILAVLVTFISINALVGISASN